MFDHYVGLALKELNPAKQQLFSRTPVNHAEPCETSNIERSAKIVKGLQPGLPRFPKRSILDVMTSTHVSIECGPTIFDRICFRRL